MTQNTSPITPLAFAARAAQKFANPKNVLAAKKALGAKKEQKMSIGLLLEQHAKRIPNRLAVKYLDQKITWAELNAQVNRYAHAFEDLGVKSGDRIAINMENRSELMAVVLACLKLGGVAAMINTAQTSDVLAHSLGLVNPVLSVVGEEQLANMATLDAATETGSLVYLADASNNPAPKGYKDLAELSANQSTKNPPSTAKITLSQPCFYIFTSGTTGLPKASIMTHYRWYRAAEMMGVITMDMTPDDTFYCCLPFYHNNALTLALSSVMISGASMAISRKFSASRFWDECRQYEATCFAYIGELLRYLINQPAKPNDGEHQVYKIFGNGLRPDIWDDFKARFNIERVHEFYGASEGNNAFINLFNFDKTCGFAMSGWEIVGYDVDEDHPVTDKDGRFKKMGTGDTGLLLFEVSDLYPFDGYTDKSASEKKLRRNVFKDGDCWFDTGDLVKSLGCKHIQFVDRVGDTFRWQGENVATTQVEAAAIKWAQTEDAVVYGVEVPGRDGRCGMLSYTVKADESLDLAGLAAHLQASLPKYAVPRFMRVEQAQEVTGTFKHQKVKLKKQGYDIKQIDEAVYYLAPGADCFEPMTKALMADVNNGSAKL